MSDLKQNNRPVSPPPQKSKIFIITLILLNMLSLCICVVIDQQSPVKMIVMSPRKAKNSPRSKNKHPLPKGQQKIDILLKSPTKSKDNLMVSV